MPTEIDRSTKYAEALLLMAESVGRIKVIESDLNSLASAISSNAELMSFFADEFVKDEGKQEAIAEMFSGKADPLLLMFIRILQVERSIGQIANVARIYSDLVAAREHRVSGELVSTVPLPAEKVASIEEETSRILNKDVSLNPVVDEDMLGGFIVRVGNFVIDGSLETELTRAQASLIT